MYQALIPSLWLYYADTQWIPILFCIFEAEPQP